MKKIGIIGGSGLYEIEGFHADDKKTELETPFGKPSAAYVTGKMGDVDIVFLARHGQGHVLSPTEINYRANIYGLKMLGVDAIVSVSACGSLCEEMEPMHFVVPDQFFDRTQNRSNTFFDDGLVTHVALAHPFDENMRMMLVEACRACQCPVHDHGTYLCMEGPQFSTLAESRLYQQWGMHIIGMTNATEAKLAREAEMAYATLAAVTDYDCWHPDHDQVTVEMILDYLHKNVTHAKQILKTAIPKIAQIENFAAQSALQSALVTQSTHVSEPKRIRVAELIKKYF